MGHGILFCVIIEAGWLGFSKVYETKADPAKTGFSRNSRKAF